MPITDWQFWVATSIAAVAAWLVLRPIARPLLRRGVRGRGRVRRTGLTIEGRPANRR
ncbi:MAG TPA: hypothetical protein PKC43_00175 [Phycisphaerales bacterium]|nr:hypothetical protein [Phycisphaerales bacterium]HMP35840.1 hypothetical protein [Phycisphaerales bacterium]